MASTITLTYVKQNTFAYFVINYVCIRIRGRYAQLTRHRLMDSGRYIKFTYKLKRNYQYAVIE